MIGVGRTPTIATQKHSPASEPGLLEFFEHFRKNRAFFEPDQLAI
jgi:hypothetical protein